MKKIKFLLRNHFGFSQRETNGFIVLVLLMFGTLFMPLLFRVFYQPGSSGSTEKNQQLLDSLLLVMAAKTPDKKQILVKDSSKKDIVVKYFYFDPNKASQSELAEVTGSDIARTIIRYRNKGGVFRVKTDLRKIYGMREEAYKALESYILLPDSLPPRSSYKKPVYSVSNIPADLNTADTSDLIRLQGVGKVFALRIVKFRDKLGGFISKEQLAEIYGLSPEVIAMLKEKFYVDPSFVPKKINLSTAGLSELQSHPYIGKRKGTLIVNYREQHGKFTSLDQLNGLKALTKEEIGKILPYAAY